MKIIICLINKKLSERINSILEQYIIQYGYMAEIIIHTDPLKCIHENNTDAFFLNLEYPQISGIYLAQRIKMVTESEIIFCGEYRDLCCKVLKVKPLGFITKDAFDTDIKESITNLITEVERKKKGVIFRDGQKKIYVCIDNITYMYSDKDYVVIVLANGNSISIRRKLPDLENKLVRLDFLRIHNRYLINLKKLVRTFQKNKGNSFVELKGNIILPISRKYTKRVALDLILWSNSITI